MRRQFSTCRVASSRKVTSIQSPMWLWSFFIASSTCTKVFSWQTCVKFPFCHGRFRAEHKKYKSYASLVELLWTSPNPKEESNYNVLRYPARYVHNSMLRQFYRALDGKLICMQANLIRYLKFLNFAPTINGSRGPPVLARGSCSARRRKSTEQGSF